MDATVWIAAWSLGLILYVHIGYPLLMWMLARLFPRPIRSAPITPPLALIISAYNEQNEIAAKIANTFALDYPADRLTIIVTCAGSDDGTADEVRRAGGGRVRVLHDGVRAGKGAAMNAAVRATSEPLLVFSDANAMYRPDALRALVSRFNDPQIGLVSGLKTVSHGTHTVGEGERTYWNYESVLRRSETRLGSTVAVVGEILAIRRDLYKEIDASTIADDVFLCMCVLNAGRRVVFADDAVSIEESSATFRDEMVRRARIAAGRFQLLLSPSQWPWRRPIVMFELVSHKMFRLFLPVILISALLSTVVLALGAEPPPGIRFVVAIQLVLYALAGLGAKRQVYWPLRKPAQVAAFFVAGHVAGLVGAFRYATGRATPLWPRVERRRISRSDAP